MVNENNYNLSSRIFFCLFLAILIIGSILRLYQLELKPMHHDEAVMQHYFIEKIADGQSLVWDFESHGFFYHYLSFIIIKIAGLSLWALRFSAALFGILTVLLIYFLKDYIGRYGVLFGAFFMAVSPFFVYYSRQYTNYPFYLFFLLLLIIILLNFYFKKASAGNLWLLAILAAILLNVNFDAFLIFVFVVLIFYYLNYLFGQKLELKNNLLKFWHWLLALIFFMLVFVFIQSSFFSQFSNVFDFAASFADLSKKAMETGHNKPITYWLTLLFPFEIGLLLVAFFGCFFHKKNLLSRFLIFCSLAFLFIFSLIPYKSNWTFIYIILPLVLHSGNTFDYLLSKFIGKKIKIALIFVVIFLGLFAFCQSIEQNFIKVNDRDKNKIGYVETLIGVEELVADVNNYAQEQETIKILIAAESYWPLPVYLRDFSIHYQTKAKQLDFDLYKDYNVVIIKKSQLDYIAADYSSKEYEFRKNYWLQVLYLE